MIPRLTELEPVAETTRAYLEALRQRGFSGDIADRMADRVVGSTDNSIYQILPQALVYPKTAADLSLVLSLGQEPRFRVLTFTARGGGTGTNGQSLTSGLVIDVGRHLRKIHALDLAASTVVVEPGVVLDELNAFLAPHGVFFAPNLSPSSRATIGGMIATDASGQGSRVYGKTSEHVVSVELVLRDGSVLMTRPLDRAALAVEMARTDEVGRVVREIMAVVEDEHARFSTEVKQLRRFLTGYNLSKCWDKERETLDLKWLVTGAEGTLGVVARATLKVTPIPTARALAVLEFESFEGALAAAENMVALDPSSIETIDEKVLTLARGDIIMNEVGAYLPDRSIGDPGAKRTAAINLVEFETSGPSARDEVDQKMATLIAACETHAAEPGWPFAVTRAANETDRKALWQLRAKGVGLLGNTKGRRKPVPFVEDTVVPPERLSAYVAEFRKILDDEGLQYGMFGHVDVGCLHVRPALDLRDAGDEARLRRISDKVAALCERYGGVVWGEHGKGFRSEYSPLHFGSLFPTLERIKGAFDPEHRLNPGKVATPPGRRGELLSIDQPLRGHKDRQISKDAQEDWAIAIDCNGNGQCFHWEPSHVMCPSSKVTRDRIHTPKGRAGVMREWLRQLDGAGHPLTKRKVAEAGGLRSVVTAPVRAFHTIGRSLGRYDYSHEVHRAMSGCLACKACATQCPVKVDVPSFRSDFLAAYHGRYLRPVRDHLVAGLESALKLMAKAPGFFNFFLKRRWFQALMKKTVGLVDTPALPERSLKARLEERGLGLLEPAVLVRSEGRGGPPWKHPERDNHVILLQDAFTSFYEPEVVLAARDLLEKLGFEVHLAPFFPNGKGLHVKGFLRRFERRVRKNHAQLVRLANTGARLVAIDPAVALTYRDEYRHVPGLDWSTVKVELLQELIVKAVAGRPSSAPVSGQRVYRLMGHCTEKTLAPASQRQWVEVFAKLGLTLKPVAAGCCGMSGVFGHEAKHLEESRGIWELSWRGPVEEAPEATLATGYSCRSQAKRFGPGRLRHPVEVLVEHLSSSPSPLDPSAAGTAASLEAQKA
ncbi:MAG TPA: FAD-binding and (Fe-S)-binding domain-containing protein [Myxococcota bacterium]|nr:FAD-binding and (Fe-S)-binding domain-containing protein [Myxococcota bacterium]